MRERVQRRQRHHTSPSHDRWLISYADFVTLLFALFIVLFASAYKDQQAVAKVSAAVKAGFKQMQMNPLATDGHQPTVPPPGPSPATLPRPGDPQIDRSAGIDIPELQKKLGEALGQEIAQKEVVLRMTPEGFVISLHELGFFASGQAELLPGAQEKIRRLAGVLTQYGLNMRIEGHTDNVPMHSARFDSNWELSTARATAVARMLLDSGDFDPERLAIAGYGEYHPAASNDTLEGRQQNRRVDIVLVTVPVNAPSPLSRH
ncbi:chemotaxis protein MotB [Bryocella elongata]|uniref:Chemotaxis protein MotB n=1 Tax=Bryocella elongata TaxID=863522 RepID=A0A1H5TL66_9BACT|nr:OmpA family protein [Bryocella elongata]SEF63516.1 chemotaxis protein MotB [Bryocella elongata]